MMACLISGAPCPALVTSTPLLQSSQRLPYLSYTKMSSALSHTSGGWPRMEIGSNLRSFSSVGTESGCGSCVTTRRYFVSTRGTGRGTILNSLPIKCWLGWAIRADASGRNQYTNRREFQRLLRRCFEPAFEPCEHFLAHLRRVTVPDLGVHNALKM